MHNAMPERRVQGFKGTSAITELKHFHIVHGVVPEYMHGQQSSHAKMVFSDTKWKAILCG